LKATVNPAKFATPDDCEAAFYAAFRKGDAEAMDAVWAADAELMCIHPAQAPIIGRVEVMQSWRQILGNSGGVEVGFDCKQRLRGGPLAAHIGIEVIGAPGNEPALVTVTNVYALTPGGWKMRSHHAGPIHRGVGRSGARGTMH